MADLLIHQNLNKNIDFLNDNYYHLGTIFN